ncbi:MAG: sigma-70 family RNA polymerase sigma factor, partial [Firmicutes bacterium]|nr:sigma-70 family RNA polymerase sigma factor [Bacillota bacterium]
MDDNELIRLFQNRDERAVAECEQQYAAFCRRIARNMLDRPEDVEECLNDVWFAAWQRIPPLVPDSMKAFLGKLTRDITVSRFREEHAAKRFAGATVALDELDDCIPSAFSVEQEVEAAALSRLIDRWLGARKKDERVLFVRRYYFGDSVKALAAAYGCSEHRMAQIMLRL